MMEMAVGCLLSTLMVGWVLLKIAAVFFRLFVYFVQVILFPARTHS